MLICFGLVDLGVFLGGGEGGFGGEGFGREGCCVI